MAKRYHNPKACKDQHCSHPNCRRKWEVESKLTVVSIGTHVPSKYRLVDLETGDVWKITDVPYEIPIALDGHLSRPRWTAADDLTFQVKARKNAVHNGTSTKDTLSKLQ